MNLGVINTPVTEHFSVVDASGTLISDINLSEFNVKLHNPTGADVSSSVTVQFNNLGGGNYKLTFTPNMLGKWYVQVTHGVFFPWSKTSEIEVFTASFSTINDSLQRALGLMQENQYMDQLSYTNYMGQKLLTTGRIRIYNHASNVGSATGVIATYQITTEWDNDIMTSYKVERS